MVINWHNIYIFFKYTCELVNNSFKPLGSYFFLLDVRKNYVIYLSELKLTRRILCCTYPTCLWVSQQNKDFPIINRIFQSHLFKACGGFMCFSCIVIKRISCIYCSARLHQMAVTIHSLRSLYV